MEEIIVSKYGGTSSSSPETIEQKRTITEDDSRRRVLVVSAHGKTQTEKKDTDLLIELATTKNLSLVDRIIGKARTIYPGLPNDVFNEMQNDLVARVNTSLPPKVYMDSLKAFGEEMCARLTSKALGYNFVDPKELFVFSPDFGNAKILPESADMIRARLSNLKHPVIVPGFYGFTKDGNIATLSRGGSDLTGAYIAAALNAKAYENFTDQLGILCADPRIVKDPKKIKEMTFNEIRDLSYSGFGVFHEEAMRPVSKQNVPIHLRSTTAYPQEGTWIVLDRKNNPDQPIVGVAYKGGFCSFDISYDGLNDATGAGRKILSVFENNGIPVEHLTTGIDDMAVILRTTYLGKESNAIGSIVKDITQTLGEESSIEFQENIGTLVVAGKGLRGKRGISAGIQRTLADADVNIKFISQGPNERCIIYGIDHEDSSKAVNAVHDRYLK